MSEPSTGQVNWITTVFAVLLLALGFGFLFSGQWMGVTFFGRNDVEPLASLMGAALIAFGAMCWVARRAALGGIYGKGVITANQVHFFVGAMVLIKHGATVGGSGMYWLLTAFYVLGAAYFCYLVITSPKRT
ncbi:MAG: hypothetical protein ABIR28_01355 [Vicinamibacteria bacterium]